MKISYTEPFYLIVNEAGQPLFSYADKKMWMFFSEDNACKFMDTDAGVQKLAYKKRYVVKVSLNQEEIIKEYITSIL